jgi:hypothetical protein
MIDTTGLTICHYNDNYGFHCLDGPAIKRNDGTKEWFVYDRLVFNDSKFVALKGDYIIVERGIPTNDMFGDLKLTNTKLLTADGIMFVPDNLPGLEIGEGNG